MLCAAEAGRRPPAALTDPVKPGLIGLAAAAAGVGCFAIALRMERKGAGEGGGGALLGVLLLVVATIGFGVAWAAWSDRRRNLRADCRQLFALTDRRALVWGPTDRAGGVEVFTIEPGLVRTVHRLEYPDGSGEVRIGYAADASGDALALPQSFVGVAEVRQVESLVRGVLVPASIPRQARIGHFHGSSIIDPFDPDDSEEPF